MNQDGAERVCESAIPRLASTPWRLCKGSSFAVLGFSDVFSGLIAYSVNDPAPDHMTAYAAIYWGKPRSSLSAP